MASFLDSLSSIYPPPEDRRPLPSLYNPTAYLFTILPWLIPKSQGRILATLPILSLLFLLRPYYTSGSHLEDYNSAIYLFCCLTGYLDFQVFSPARSEPEPRFQGASKVPGSGNHDTNPSGTGIEDCHTLCRRLKFAIRLNTFGRGIGWNWQVKNVPAITDAKKPKWVYVRGRLGSAIPSFIKKTVAVYLLGATIAVQNHSDSGTPSYYLLNIAIGWLVAAWAWHSMNFIHDLAAAASVALGICDRWEWPPFFGPLEEMWSVRRTWSVTWHQWTRRMLNHPAILLTRLLGLRKGTLLSRYAQLYLTFLFSLALHWYLIFNAVRHDVGEFRFFLSQPVIITVEDIVQHGWRRYTGNSKSDPLTAFERMVGYMWTITWFSICLPPFTQGLIGARIAGFDAESVLRMGLQHADDFFLRDL
ncbi:hypothetical protein AC578_10289 [Pseudocercospora eumusae]|uniref:Wax synthase domain-containing protein n=1 Tax=Pseudocercospora eumusae TaxID=321146 RepID=A0A139HRI7_9PEZI|nr:hypothetical protein AC578_10289 [Pseudocercospora eumusae]